MRSFLRTVATTLVLLFLPAPSGRAQTIDMTGHWTGAIQAPERLVEVEIELALNAKGQLAGTFAQPIEQIKGLPFSSVRVDGRTVQLLLKPGGSGGGTFEGTLAADGKSISGDFVMADAKFRLPFELTRAGDAVIAPAPKSRAITKALEGTWNGALEIGAERMRLSVTMANQADGTATGTVVSHDGAGVEIAIAITEAGLNVTIEVPSVGAWFAGVRNPAATEITGTWKDPRVALPLTLKRAGQ